MSSAPNTSGSIPAWAGETVKDTLLRAVYRVYPRVGGGNLCSRQLAIRRRGLSPRGRGKRVRVKSSRLIIGSIPAWAGET